MKRIMLFTRLFGWFFRSGDSESANKAVERGISAFRKGDIDTAISDFTEAIRLNPKHPLAYSNRGGAYGSKGELDKAISDFTEAIQLDPDLPLWQFIRGKAYRNMGEHDKAIADLRRPSGGTRGWLRCITSGARPT